MRIYSESADIEVLEEIGKRMKGIRVSLMKTQEDIAALTGVSLRTVKNLEAGKDVAFSTMIRVMRALRILQNLDDAVPEPRISPIEISDRGKPRQRVRKSGRQNTWKWGDEK